MLEFQRYHAIEAIISTCHGWIQRFRDTYTCPMKDDQSFSCSSILLGALTKEMHRLSYLSPELEIPFEGRSIESIYKNVREMTSPIWCHDCNFGYHNYHREKYHRPHTCSLQSTLGPSVDAILEDIQGLDLNKFKKFSRKP